MQIEEKKTLGRLDMLIFLKGKICKMSSIITYVKFIHVGISNITRAMSNTMRR